MIRRKRIYTVVYKLIEGLKFLRELKNELKIKSLQAEGVPTQWLVNKVFEFCQTYSEITFYPYQEQFSKRLIRSLLENDGQEITALFARQTGKIVY